MNILVDMNLSPSWVDFLTGAGFTAVDWSDEGPPTARDRDVLRWCAERDYVLLTTDLDVDALPPTEGQRPRVIVIKDTLLIPEAAGSAVLAAIHRAKAGSPP